MTPTQTDRRTNDRKYAHYKNLKTPHTTWKPSKTEKHTQHEPLPESLETKPKHSPKQMTFGLVALPT